MHASKKDAACTTTAPGHDPLPRLYVNLRKIEHNTRTIVRLARMEGISITGVTKGTCGDPRVAAAMLAGGVQSIGDSRIKNIKRMKQAGVQADMMLLRTPMISELPEVVAHADISLQSDISVMKKLSAEARRQKIVHRVVLMVEFGERREGLVGDEVGRAVEVACKSPGIELYGIGTNLACLTGVVPTEEKMAAFEAYVGEVERACNVQFSIVGGGNSANIPLLLAGTGHRRTNNLRIGEGILLGRETVYRRPIPQMYQDAFILEGELIEVKMKPSVPDGEISQNAYGETPVFKDTGMMQRGLVALGRQDVRTTGLTPRAQCLSAVASSSDHLVVDMDGDARTVGDTLEFDLDYAALVSAFTSPYVSTVYLED
jgi:predicted amino acid racemase